MSRVVIVGAGILGTMHALMARRAGWHVTHLDADLEPRSASVRNFGLVWVSGRAEGDELELALRARALWGEIAADAPGVGLRADGSMLVVQQPEERTVLEQVVQRADAGARGFRLLEPDEVRAVNPAIGGEVLAGLHCSTDAVVEPRLALAALRGRLESGDGDTAREYTFHGGRIAVEIGPGYVVDHTGERHRGEVVIVCPGAERHGPIAELVAGAPIRRVQLQMMQTAPLGERLTTSIADGDSMRYYPAFDVPARADLPPQAPVAAAHHMQLLISQRADGELTVGDTHAYDEPFDFAESEAAYDHLHDRAASILGRPLPPVERRWTGVYSQALDGAICHRRQVQLGVWVVTGPGGRGMTLSPAIAEQTVAEIGFPRVITSPEIRLAVLDMAGTTVRDDGIVESSFLLALEGIGIPRDDPAMAGRLEYVQATMGQSKIEVFRGLLGDEDLAQRATRGFEAAIAETVRAGAVSALPGAEDAFAAMRAAGVKICLTTGFAAETQQLIVDALAWGELVDLTLAPGNGLRGRPHPDLALHALMVLGLDDVRTIAVAGDTANDLLAGWRAGAGVVAGVLTGAHDRADLEATPHTHILDSIAELPDVLGL